MAWIYLPEKLERCHCSQESEGASSEASSQGSGRSAMSSGASTVSKFSRRGSRMEFSTMPRSGMTSGHSTGKNGLASWMSSLRDSRVRRSVLWGRGWERAATRTCGLIPFASLERSGRNGVCWRTFLGFSRPDTSGKFSLIWPKSGMMLGGIACRLRPLERLIGGSVFGSSATELEIDLCEAEKFPTPRAIEHGRGFHRDIKHYNESSYGKMLSSIIKLREKFPTPRASNPPRDSPSRDMTLWEVIKIRSEKRKWLTPTKCMERISKQRPGLRQNVDGGIDKSMLLNPDWVEWLMGYPAGLSSVQPMKEKFVEEWRESVRSMSWWNDERRLSRLIKKRKGNDVRKRLEVIGNGQVSVVAYAAWELLMEGDEEIMDIMTKEQRSHVMRSVGRERTAPERRLTRWLRKIGVEMSLNVKELPGSPDIVVEREKVIVFVDGCFWHGCPEHYRKPAFNQAYWDKKLRDNKNRDKRNDIALTKARWKVLRIWEHEIVKTNKKKIIHKILKGG